MPTTLAGRKYPYNVRPVRRAASPRGGALTPPRKDEVASSEPTNRSPASQGSGAASERRRGLSRGAAQASKMGEAAGRAVAATVPALALPKHRTQLRQGK